MATSISQYLKSIGVNTPYTDDLTEAQISERSKANPLSGYGFQSAEEQTQLQQRQQAYRDALDQQQQQQTQAMLMQSSPQRATGHYAGAGIKALIDKLRESNGPQGPAASPKNDPALDRFTQLAAEVGPDQAKIMLGQELMQGGDQRGAAMMQEGQAAIQKQQKATMEGKTAELGLENVRSQIEERKTKPNTVITAQRTIDGKPGQVSLELMGRDPKSGANIYHEIGQSVKGSVTGTPSDFGKTGTQAGAAAGDFEKQMTSTENALDTNDRIQDIIDKNPTAVGFQGALSSQASDLVYGVKGLSDLLGTENDKKLQAVMASEDPVGKYSDVFDKMSGNAVKNRQLQALLLDQAYLMATAGGQKATDADVRNQLKVLGGNINDPKAFKTVIQQNRELLIQRLQNAGKNTGTGGKPLGDLYTDRLKGISDRKTRGPTEDDMKEYKRLKEKYGR